MTGFHYVVMASYKPQIHLLFNYPFIVLFFDSLFLVLTYNFSHSPLNLN